MQCANCEREIMQAGSLFCPFCASPVTFVDQPTKKKNEEIMANRPAPTEDGRGSWLAVLVFCAPLFQVLLLPLRLQHLYLS